MSTLVVGAGISGLQVSQMLQAHGRTVVVVEKSRGVGGRMATRRSEKAKWDHGAQFYSLKPGFEELHRQWRSNQLSELWFETEAVQKFKSNSGMTALAKSLSRDLKIQTDCKLLQLRKYDELWTAHLENGASLQAKSVVLTCPLPQSLEILRKSGIPYDPSLDQIHYAKALVGLFESVRTTQNPLPASGYFENACPSIFSIIDQSAKGLCVDKSWTVVMSPGFSHEFFELPDEETLSLIRQELRKLIPDFESQSGQLKKWRFSHPLSVHSKPFESPAQGLFLCGDSFGGPSLHGALVSARALTEFLLR